MHFKGDCLCVHSVVSLCGPMDCSLPGSSVHENFQARILEQLPNPGIKPMSPAWQADSLPLCRLGIPLFTCRSDKKFVLTPVAQISNELFPVRPLPFRYKSLFSAFLWGRRMLTSLTLKSSWIVKQSVAFPILTVCLPVTSCLSRNPGLPFIHLCIL